MNKNVHKGASLGSVQSVLFDFATTWTTVRQASMSITNSQSLPFYQVSISPSNEYSGMISFRMDWLAFLAMQGTLARVLKHNSRDVHQGRGRK